MYTWKRLETIKLYFTKVTENDYFDAELFYINDGNTMRDVYKLTLDNIDENYQLNDALSLQEIEKAYMHFENVSLCIHFNNQEVLLKRGGTCTVPLVDKTVQILGSGMEDLPEAEHYDLEDTWYTSTSLDQAHLRFIDATKDTGDTVVVYEDEFGKKTTEYFSLVEGRGETATLRESDLWLKYPEKKAVEIYVIANAQSVIAGLTARIHIRTISSKLSGFRLYLKAPFKFYLPEVDWIWERSK